jgi:hypothetical protein
MRLSILASLVLILVVAPAVAWASGKADQARLRHDQHPPAATAPGQEAPAPPAIPAEGSSVPAGDAKNLDFDFFANEQDASPKDGSAPNRDAVEVAAKAATRRWMLKTHQTLGLVTWALMAATVTVGQLNYHQLYGGGGGSNRWQGTHKALVITTSLAFAGTGAFAIFAPRPYARPLKFDTGLVHRIAVAGAALGMVSEIVLGLTTKRRADAGNSRALKTLALTHQIIGYSTFGLLTVAATVWVF